MRARGLRGRERQEPAVEPALIRVPANPFPSLRVDSALRSPVGRDAMSVENAIPLAFGSRAAGDGKARVVSFRARDPLSALEKRAHCSAKWIELAFPILPNPDRVPQRVALPKRPAIADPELAPSACPPPSWAETKTRPPRLAAANQPSGLTVSAAAAAAAAARPVQTSVARSSWCRSLRKPARRRDGAPDAKT